MNSIIPSSEEFELLEELIEILTPFDEATQFLSGSKYPTLGFMTPMLEELARRLKYFNGQNNQVILVRDTILENLIDRWGDPSEIGMYCSFLDPRFKKLNFCTSALRREMVQNMRQQFDELQSINNDDAINNNDPTSDNETTNVLHKRKKSKMSTFFAHLRTQNFGVERDEFDRYCEIPEISLDEGCPLDWWCQHKALYPTLAILARRYLAVPASSVLSERLFSNAGNHVTDKRNRLDPDLLNQLVFLKKNIRYVDSYFQHN
jgi:hypothetical protein